MQQHGQISDIIWAKYNRLQTGCPIWFHLYETQEQTKLIHGDKNQKRIAGEEELTGRNFGARGVEGFCTF